MYRLIIWSLFKVKKIYGAPVKPSELFCFKDTKNFAVLFFLAAYNKKFQWTNATDTAQDGNDPPDDWLKLEFFIIISGQSITEITIWFLGW